MSLVAVLRTATLACTLLASLGTAAQTLGSKPVRLVVPFAPGGATDIVARAVADSLARELGRTVIVENRAGAGGSVGANFVSKAAPDGDTLGVATVSTMAANPAINPKNPYHPVSGFTPVITLATVPVVLAVNRSRLPVGNLKELIALLLQQPGKHAFASAGTGGVGHLDGELFKALTHTDLTHVPYKGAGPAITDLLAGQVDMMFDNLPSMLPHFQSGALQAIAVMSPQRSPSLPDVPTFTEGGLRTLDNTAWMGLVAPPDMPSAVRDGLQAAAARSLNDPAVRKRFADAGIQPAGGSAADFAALIEKELKLRQRIVAEQKLKLD
ncbi:Bug family tripartite tricarboxylate transporter substrate binding protein [Variovorax arabinosiphilus]|uniref:Bug family tripartite tricarboxylate transporter substrate binding protein n=1 Tax=Variovorax arabinosiphilus TaxID=3053498 RepID=UPI002578FE72|nr:MULTISPECIES: tripartite tricarboxylate transporter substrate binding protein [unclassified Variovorax]MDM0123056.1 tripartite tricarboxylate transporter substrate binding protein [Variovorax sp. J2L1-78]MDM0131948.1 tripartite tricarboxylate transporter substrate binding protein [Variovorax sp. J2L1-63]MDM0235819.1 tripartite tricarboxylate transporter substrate binding protein [Variovorax sp. J2R1-6]